MTHSEELLQRELDGLSEELQPDRDLWPGIDHALNTPSFRAHLNFSRLALLGTFVLLMTYAGTQFFTPAFNDNDTEVLQLLSALQNQHSQNKQTLLVRYSENNPSYQNWEIEMQQLEEAEALIYEDLLQDPGNLTLLSFLRQVQSKQLELLNTVYAPRITII